MSTPLYNDEQLILAARLYFLDGLAQLQIGKLVNVSQSKVSRMLALPGSGVGADHGAGLRRATGCSRTEHWRQIPG